MRKIELYFVYKSYHFDSKDELYHFITKIIAIDLLRTRTRA